MKAATSETGFEYIGAAQHRHELTDDFEGQSALFVTNCFESRIKFFSVVGFK
ncbi:MAG: hypothetical protein IPH54_22165 [Rhodoferax sp.]|nr:hypothetical protein [Rhodoferax sp.]